MRAVPRERQAGFVLVAVVLTLGTVGAIAFLLARDGGMASASVRSDRERELVRLVAEAGLAHARFLANQSGCGGYDLPTTPFGSHSYAATFSPDNGSPVSIAATGTLASGASHTLTRGSVSVYEPTPVTVVLQPDATEGKDVWYTSGAPTSNYGDHAELQVSLTQRSMIEFDLSSVPPSAQIRSATLELLVDTLTPGPVTVHAVTTPWVEGTCSGTGCTADGATWNTSDGTTTWTTPGGDHDSTPAATAFVTASGAWETWDVTKLVAAWVSGELPNFGLLLRPGSGANVDLRSSDHGSTADHPKLTIVYACECGGGPPQSTLMQPGPAGEDTWISDQFNLQNFGADPEIRLATKATRLQRGLIRFDLSSIPNQALVTSATLTLNLESVGSGNSGPVDVHRVTVPWVEGTSSTQGSCWDGASWLENDGACGPWPTPGGDYDAASSATATVDAFLPGPVSWNVKDLVQGWVDGTNPNYGAILIAGLGLNNVDFTTGDGVNPADHPILAFEWICPCGATCSVAPPPSYKDELTANNCDAADYTGSEGTLDWSPWSWVEVGESNGSCTGSVRLESDLGDNSLRLQDDGRGASRAADLSSFSAAHLSFDYRYNDLETDDALLVETWDDSTSSWVEVGRLDGLSGTATDYQRASFEITPYASAASAIRFVTSSFEGSGGQTDQMFLDDILIDEIGGGSGGGGASDHEITLNPTADVTLEEGSGNLGGDPELHAGRANGGSHKHAFLEFDVSSIPAGSPIVSATLRLNASHSRGNDPYNVGAHRGEQSWVEMEADWDEAAEATPWTAGPGGTYNPTPVSSVPAGGSGWYEWDVTPLVQEWVDGVFPNQGVAMVHTSVVKGNRLEFHSSEGSAPTKWPELVVQYNDP